MTEARELVYQTLTQKGNGKGGLATEGRLVGL